MTIKNQEKILKNWLSTTFAVLELAEKYCTSPFDRQMIATVQILLWHRSGTTHVLPDTDDLTLINQLLGQLYATVRQIQYAEQQAAEDWQRYLC